MSLHAKGDQCSPRRHGTGLPTTSQLLANLRHWQAREWSPVRSLRLGRRKRHHSNSGITQLFPIASPTCARRVRGVRLPDAVRSPEQEGTMKYGFLTIAAIASFA